jgi:hypothetical protein
VHILFACRRVRRDDLDVSAAFMETHAGSGESRGDGVECGSGASSVPFEGSGQFVEGHPFGEVEE